MAMDFERVKAYLKRANGNGDTLYNHLTNLLLKVNKENTEDVVNKLEELSVAVKNAALEPPLFKELPATPQDPSSKVKTLAAVKATLKLFDTLPTVTSEDRAAVEASLRALASAGEDEEDGGKAAAQALLPEVMKGPNIPNLLGHGNMLEWAGVNLGREELFKISMSMRGLTASNKDILSVRFFGKIFGTQKDYYVVETKMAPPAEKEKVDPKTKQEPRGTGANEFVYYVTNSLLKEWEALPDVLPEQIITARAMRRFLTGNLHAPVLGYPRFAWPEASFLRATIARIAAATVISPRGLFTMEEAEEEGEADVMKEDPEFESPGAEEMTTGEGWCHHRAHLLKQGRAKKWEPPEGEDEDEEPPPEDEEEEEEEEPVPMLNALESDEGNKQVPNLWKYKAYGSTQHAVFGVYSMQWPGAVTVAKGKAFANIYVGHGQKHLGSRYAPPPLPAVASEYTSGFNPEEAEEDETDPMLEQVDPLPPRDLEGDDEGEGDDEDEDDE